VPKVQLPIKLINACPTKGCMTKCIDGILFTNYLKEKTEIIIEKTKNIFV
jgi:hypothetical protein